MNYYLKYQIWFSAYYAKDLTKNRDESDLNVIKAGVNMIV